MYKIFCLGLFILCLVSSSLNANGIVKNTSEKFQQEKQQEQQQEDDLEGDKNFPPLVEDIFPHSTKTPTLYQNFTLLTVLNYSYNLMNPHHYSCPPFRPPIFFV